MQHHLDQLISFRNGLGDDKNQLQWIPDENQLQPSQIDSISRLRVEKENERSRAGW